MKENLKLKHLQFETMSHQHTDLITSIQNNSGSNTNNYEQKNIINKEEEFNSSQHKEHACKIVYYSKDDVDNNQIVIKECAKELSKGNLVSFPTETGMFLKKME